MAHVATVGLRLRLLPTYKDSLLSRQIQCGTLRRGGNEKRQKGRVVLRQRQINRYRCKYPGYFNIASETGYILRDMGFSKLLSYALTRVQFAVYRCTVTFSPCISPFFSGSAGTAFFTSDLSALKRVTPLGQKVDEESLHFITFLVVIKIDYALSCFPCSL